MRFTNQILLLLPLATALFANPVQADFITVYGGPEYSSSTSTGYQNPGTEFSALQRDTVNNSGIAVGYAQKFVAGTSQGHRAVRWDGSGASATELDSLSTDHYDVAVAVNDSGTAVGSSEKFVSGISYGARAVRWNGSGASATELDNLGTDGSSVTYNYATNVNDSGTAVGYAEKYVSGNSYGYRAVRWEGSGTSATELDNLGTDVSQYTFNEASAINDSGTAVGHALKYASGTDYGYRAVRWDGSGTSATELDNLGTNGSSVTDSRATDVNDSGTAVGYAEKFVAGTSQGYRAVRWDGSGASATELDNLGTDASSVTDSRATDVNDSGTAVGYAEKYVSGTSQGDHAVRWDGSGTSATELGHLSTNVNDFVRSIAINVNDSGTAVGGEFTFALGTFSGFHAVAWKSDALAIDLNTLIDPASGWLLNFAESISNTGWISGVGTFDPDGLGGEDAYSRHFVLNINPVPEPGTLVLAGLATLGLTRLVRQRRGNRLRRSVSIRPTISTMQALLGLGVTLACFSNVAHAATISKPLDLSVTGAGLFSSSGASSQQVAENFTLSAAAQVTKVDFWGWFIPDSSSGSFDILFLNDASGLPAASHFYSYNTGSVGGMLVANDGGTDIYRWSVLLPTPAEFSTAGNYWISIRGNSLWAWEYSTNQDSTLQSRFGDNGTWTASFAGGGGNQAVILETVPEPSSVVLASVGLAGLLVARRNRRGTRNRISTPTNDS